MKLTILAIRTGTKRSKGKLMKFIIRTFPEYRIKRFGFGDKLGTIIIDGDRSLTTNYANYTN